MDAPTRIDLAAELPFTIGKLHVIPSLLEVQADGVGHAVPPRVMQVLVALSGARGRTVSRDELGERCWSGRVVSEDALNRVIAKLRAVAQNPGGGSFTIETVKRVGYRLVSIDGTAAEPLPGFPEAAPARRRRPLLGPLIGGGAVLALAIIWWFTRNLPAPPATPEPLVAAAADMETRGLSAVFEGGAQRTAEGIGYLRQATAMQPRRAKIWGSLAMAYVLSLAETPPGDRDAVVARIRESAGRAKALDRREGRSIAAVASLTPTFGNWSAKDLVLRRGLQQAEPGVAPLEFQRVLFLSAVGRTREALRLVDGLNTSSPLVPWIQAARINLLATAGRPDEAERVANWAGGVWPRNRLIWFTRFDLAAYGDRSGQALALAAAGSPDQTEPQEVTIAVATARAMASRAPADADAVLAEYRRLVPTGQGYAERAVRAAAALGRSRDALAFADMLYRTDLPAGPRAVAFPGIGLEGRGERNTAFLFIPSASRLWREPGFAALVMRIGLVDYWQRAGAPDLCGKVALAFCKTLPNAVRDQL